MAKNLRQLTPWMLPSWLTRGRGGALVHVLGMLLDAGVQRFRDAALLRMPGRAGTSALDRIGRDRGILRGRTETAEHYADRIRSWRYPRGHRTRGTAFALIDQVARYFDAANVWLIDRHGQRYLRDEAGANTVTHGVSWAWGGTSSWGQFWLVIDGRGIFDSHDIADWPPDETTIGIAGMSTSDARAIRGLLGRRHAWRPAGTRGVECIVSLDGSWPVPDGDWTTWTGRWAANSPYRWIMLEDSYSYGGVRGRFPSSSTDMWTFTGERGNAWSGSGPRGTWTDTCTLPDDADRAPTEITV